MAKGRPPKPTNLLELSGAYKKHPERRKKRVNEPQAKPAGGNIPSFDTRITEEQAYLIIMGAVPDGVITGSDEIGVRVLAKSLKRVWNNEAMVSEMQMLHVGLGRLGMNPSDRSRLQVSQDKKPKNRWTSEEKVG